MKQNSHHVFDQKQNRNKNNKKHLKKMKVYVGIYIKTEKAQEQDKMALATK